MPVLPPGSVYDWYPARLLHQRSESQPEPFALVVLNQPLTNWNHLAHLWTRASYRVAADGGANRLYDEAQIHLGTALKDLDVIIGDLDSLRDDTRQYFEQRGTPAGGTRATTVIHDPDQYSTDFGKAVHHIATVYPGMDLVILGSVGGRVDQGVSQLHHLYVFQAEDEANRETAHVGRRAFLLSPDSLTFLLPSGKHRIHVRAHDGNAKQETIFAKHVGFLPLQGPCLLTTRGLEWDVSGWRTQIGHNLSSSNHLLPTTTVVEAQTDQPIVFTIALKDAQ